MSRRACAAVVAVGLGLAGAAGCSSAHPAASAVPAGPVQTTDPAAANYSYPPVATFGPGSGVTFDTSSPSPNDPVAAQSAAPEQVTYACTGHAPGGVRITYGPNGSQHSAGRLPFTHTDPLAAGAEYYVTVAQLQGGGSVSCTTTVQTDDLDGSAQEVATTGSADGGYNLASAQVCSSFTGAWEKC
jgi:hypothetical protein